jgi:preprotein translocase subunit SecD
MVLGITVGLLVSRGGASTRPVSPAVPVSSAAAVTAKVNFSIRPSLCYAPPYAAPAGQAPSSGPLPACSPSTQLTASNLQVAPESGNVNGYTSNSNVEADTQFATYPSTSSPNDKQNQDVLLPTTPADGPDRYVLGPVGLGRNAIAHAHATHIGGQWAIFLALTPRGARQWDSLAAQQFHAVVGVVINGQVVSAPITQPTQSSFTSFDGQLQISGGFTEHQAKEIASGL